VSGITWLSRPVGPYHTRPLRILFNNINRLGGVLVRAGMIGLVAGAHGRQQSTIPARPYRPIVERSMPQTVVTLVTELTTCRTLERSMPQTVVTLVTELTTCRALERSALSTVVTLVTELTTFDYGLRNLCVPFEFTTFLSFYLDAR